MIKLWGFFLVITLSLFGCERKHANIQDIPIKVYNKPQDNIQLAQELVYYDPAYLNHKLPSFNPTLREHIQLGYFVSKQGGANYRIAYDAKAEAIASQLATLKKAFSDYIPQLAKQHASKSALFEQLIPLGDTWLDSLFNQSIDHTLANSSELLQFSINDEQLSIYLELVKQHYGEPQDRTYQRAQFYEAHNDIPESVSLFYQQAFASNRSLTIRVSLHQQRDEWKVMGLNIQGVNTRRESK